MRIKRAKSMAALQSPPINRLRTVRRTVAAVYSRRGDHCMRSPRAFKTMSLRDCLERPRLGWACFVRIWAGQSIDEASFNAGPQHLQ